MRSSFPLKVCDLSIELDQKPYDYVKAAAESRARELEAAIIRYRDCGIEIERFSIQEHPDMTALCIDGVPRFTWRLLCVLPPNS